MKAMVLAAGAGSRLMPLTAMVPKPMLNIADQPLLELTVQYLHDFNIRNIVMNLHHLPDVITGHFQNGSTWGVEITYSYEPRLLGTAGAVKKVAHMFTESFVVMYGDNLTTCDLHSLKALHTRLNATVTVALFNREDTSQSGVAELDGTGRIRRFIEKPRAGETYSKWVSAGILVAEPEIFEFIPDDVPFDFGRDLLPLLVAHGKSVYGYQMSRCEKLWWIDTPEDYQRVCDDFSKERFP